MSLILKGIDLPEKNKGLYVYIFNGKAEVVHPLDACEVMHINGEAIQVPKDHGRIIDTSQPIEEIIKAMPQNIYDERDEFYTWGLERAIDEINDAPTILEAEE